MNNRYRIDRLFCFLKSFLIERFSGDEGLYECRAESKAGSIRASKIVQMLTSAQKDALYSNISLPSKDPFTKTAICC
jgi:hypothetical protein